MTKCDFFGKKIRKAKKVLKARYRVINNNNNNLSMYYGNKIQLRALKSKDLATIFCHWNNYNIRKYLLLRFPTSDISEKEWLDRAMRASPTRSKELILGIETIEEGELIGTIGLHTIDLINRTAEFGIAIFNEEFLGKGYGTDAGITMLHVGFSLIGLESIFLRVIDFNKRGIKSYEKIGFRPVGWRRRAVYSEGEFHDLLVMDIIKDEFFQRYGKKINQVY